MNMRLTLAALAGSAFLAVAAVPALADSPPQAATAEKQASIPFVNSGSIRDYRAVGRDTLYVQSVGGKWYRAKLMSDCLDLPYAQAIGFDARGTNRFDRFSAVIVRGQRCALTSLVQSGPPPKKAKKG
jgi:hypothetical protein